MAQDNPPIIARDLGPAARSAARIVFVLAIVAGVTAAVHFARLDLTLSHFDARAHLVVPRRVFDSLTPGWRQLGGLWLPLPHLLNLLPSLWDWNYRTGIISVAISIVTCAAGLSALGAYLVRRTGSLGLAVAVPLTILLNPGLLYLQSTPMTEPMLIGISFIALSAVDHWMSEPDRQRAQRAGWWLSALVLTRYEGWFIAAGLLAVAGAASLQRRSREFAAMLAYPVAALAAFAVLSRASTGSWLTTSGFFVPNNPALGQPLTALDQVVSMTRAQAAPVLLLLVAAGILAIAWTAIRGRSLAPILPIALLTTAALPLAAFEAGHPERVRYVVPLIAGCGVVAGLSIGLLPRLIRGPAALALLALAVIARPPFASDAPVVVESEWERPLREGRRAVTGFLLANYDGTPILASMSSLGHYMQETSAIGLTVRDFLHEGNGDLWLDALASPRRHVRWVLVEEDARGGDVLAQRARVEPQFLSGFIRVAEGGGVALYKFEVRSQK